MNTPRLLCLTACAAVAMVSCVHAQNTGPAATVPRPTPPPGPLLVEAPDFAAWSIVRQVVPGTSDQPAQTVLSGSTLSKPESVVKIIKTGQIRHRLLKVKTGEQEDVWYEHGNRVTMESTWKMPLFESGTSQPKLPQGPDFPELAWVSEKNYAGQEKFQGAVYSVFETNLAERGPVQETPLPGSKRVLSFRRAFIDADTHLPFLLQADNSLQRYYFQAPPTATLEVPPPFQALFDAYEKAKIAPVRLPMAP